MHIKTDTSRESGYMSDYLSPRLSEFHSASARQAACLLIVQVRTESLYFTNHSLRAMAGTLAKHFVARASSTTAPQSACFREAQAWRGSTARPWFGARCLSRHAIPDRSNALRSMLSSVRALNVAGFRCMQSSLRSIRLAEFKKTQPPTLSTRFKLHAICESVSLTAKSKFH